MTEDPISMQALTAPVRHIFFSPHYDDIALSCGGTAALIAAAGKTPEVMLIFGDHPDPAAPLTAFAEKLHRQWGLDAAAVIASRRAEEEAASTILGTEARFLPFRDAIYRGERYLSDEQLFAGEPAADESSLPHEIIEALDLSAADLSSARFYAPLAVGFHVDHQHAFAAGVELAQAGAEVWFYEDLPYGLLPGALDRRISSIAAPIAPEILVDVASVWETKIDAIFAYPSQLFTIFNDYVGIGTSRVKISDAMGDYARQIGDELLCEGFWTLTQPS
jgi:LmbE family N-acetylglucosaminyl deacetylase